MAIIKIEGKEVHLDDEVIKAGDKAIRAVLAANGFPAVENARIEIVGAQNGAPAIVGVTKQATTKGSSPEEGLQLRQSEFNPLTPFLEVLINAPEYANPAIKLAAQVVRAEADGDEEFFDRAARSGVVERAIEEGEREGREAMTLLASFGHCIPQSSKKVPVGF